MAKEVLKLLDNLEANAEYKGMDLDALKITSTVVHKSTRSRDLLLELWEDLVPSTIH